MTHKVPKNKTPVLLDHNDTNGKSQPQYMVKEKTTVPVDMQDFKEHEKTTEFVQQDHIRKIIKRHMLPNSTLSLKDTSRNDTPLDENA